MNSRDQLQRKAQKSRKEKDWTVYKKQRNKCNNLVNKAKASSHQNLIEENATNPKQFWNCIKAVFPSKSCRIQTCTNLNLNSTVKTFSNYFSGAVKKLKALTYPLENFTWQYIRTLSRRTNEHFTLDYISSVFVLKELKVLKGRKLPVSWYFFRYLQVFLIFLLIPISWSFINLLQIKARFINLSVVRISYLSVIVTFVHCTWLYLIISN